MSTTIREHAEHATERARLLKLVAERFPNARFERLWDGGPPVPIVNCDEGRGLADRVMVRMIDGMEKFVAFFVLGADDEGHGGIAIWWCDYYRRGAYCSAVLEELDKSSHELHAKIVEAAKRR